MTDGSAGRKTRLAMIDLDGTLVDTLDANFAAYRAALNEVGSDITREYYAERCDGRSYRDFLPAIMGEGNPLIAAVHERKKQIYAGCVEKTVLNRHLVSILRGLRPEYYLALVTTASEENVRNILNRHQLTDFFDLVLTQEQMKIPKPAPDCYLEVMAHFGVGPADAVIFEDSEPGIRAALASGCEVYCLRGFSGARRQAPETT